MELRLHFAKTVKWNAAEQTELGARSPLSTHLHALHQRPKFDIHSPFVPIGRELKLSELVNNGIAKLLGKQGRCSG